MLFDWSIMCHYGAIEVAIRTAQLKYMYLHPVVRMYVCMYVILFNIYKNKVIYLYVCIIFASL